jgi:hypothetical protein
MKNLTVERILSAFPGGTALLVPCSGVGQILASHTGGVTAQTIYGVCVYVVGDTSYYSTAFALPATSRPQAANADLTITSSDAGSASETYS